MVLAAVCVAAHSALGAIAPVAHWTLDAVDKGVVTDAVGGHNGTVAGQLRDVAGAEGKSQMFDGSSAVVAVPSVSELSIGGAPFAVTAWVNTYDLSGAQQMIVAKNDYAGNKREWGLMVDKDNQFAFYIRQGGWKTLKSKTVPVLVAGIIWRRLPVEAKSLSMSMAKRRSRWSFPGVSSRPTRP